MERGPSPMWSKEVHHEKRSRNMIIDDEVECPRCGGSGITLEGWDCDYCDGDGVIYF
jgi:DnaJ-class molecular chaperone